MNLAYRDIKHNLLRFVLTNFVSMHATPCGPPNPRNAVFEGRFVLHTCPVIRASGR